MTTVANVIDRVYRDWLLPPDEQPARFETNEAVVAADVEFNVDSSMLAPEEQDLIGPGTLIEVDSELILVTGVTGDPPTNINVRREMFGTTAAAHDNGEIITLAPDWPRQSVFEAVADSIEALWPELWKVKVEETYLSDSPVELPSDCEDVIEVRVLSSNSWVPVQGWEFLTYFPHASTERAIQYPGLTGTPACHIKYRAATVRPTDETDVLDTDLNVSDSWIKAICAGAVAELIAHEDIDRATVEFITESLANEGFGVGSGADIRNALLQYRNFLLEPLKRSLETRTRANRVQQHRWL